MRIVFALWIIVNMPLFFGCIYTLYKYIQHRHTITYRSLYFVALLYILTTFALTILNVVWGTNGLIICCKPNIFYENLQMVFYSIQTYLLWILLVVRCYMVFRGSVYQLSIYTKYSIFISLFIIMPILFLAAITFELSIGRWVLITILFLFSMAFYIWITLIFIYKLYSVFKNSRIDTNDDHLLDTITKNTILAIFSFTATVIAIHNMDCNHVTN